MLGIIVKKYVQIGTAIHAMEGELQKMIQLPWF